MRTVKALRLQMITNGSESVIEAIQFEELAEVTQLSYPASVTHHSKSLIIHRRCNLSVR